MSRDVLIRFATESDHPFVFNSWLKSHRDIYFHDEGGEDKSEDPTLKFKRHRWTHHDSTKHMTRVTYFSSYKTHVQRLVTNSKTLLACDPSKPDYFYAYVVFQKVKDTPIIHYAYTKQIYRKMGFVKKLLSQVTDDPKSKPMFVTFYNSVVKDLRSNYNLIFDPYILE